MVDPGGDTLLALLADLAKLLKKHGPETFEALASKLAQPDFAASLSKTLADVAHAHRAAAPVGRSHSEKAALSRYRRELVKSDAPESRLLLSFLDEIFAKRVLPSAKDVNAFVAESKLPMAPVTSRERAIIPLLEALKGLPVETLRKRLESVKRFEDDDRSLRGWSEIILGSSQASRVSPAAAREEPPRYGQRS
ncbi:MAG TPA: hypothetical protein VGP72_22370 [Planctomycetota bacterium]|jgi:hypothetical protein